MKNEAQAKRAYKLQQTVKAAVRAADLILLESWGDDKDKKVINDMNRDLLINLILQIRHSETVINSKYIKTVLRAIAAIIEEIHKSYPEDNNQLVAQYAYFQVIKAYVDKVENVYSQNFALWEIANPSS